MESDCELIGPKTTLRNVAVPLAERRERKRHCRRARCARSVSLGRALSWRYRLNRILDIQAASAHP